jgi:glycine hydroxymethyltransferase
MVANARALADELQRLDVPVYATDHGHTTSHQLVADASVWGGGHAAAVRLRGANILSSAIGLPGSDTAGLRFGTPEITRFGMTASDMPELAQIISAGLRDRPGLAAPRASALRRRFDTIGFVRGGAHDPDAGGAA